MRALLLTGVSAGAILISVVGASAADVRVAPARIVAPIASTWDGHYWGVVAGAGLFTATGPSYGYKSYSYTDQSQRTWGGTLGVTAGINRQTGNALLGIEGDFSWSNLEAASSAYTTPDYYQMKVKWNWLATLRARAGLAVGNALVYATGGLAVVNRTNSFCNQVSVCGTSSYDASNSAWQIGLAAGAGAEWMMSSRMSLKLEYLYVALPTSQLVNTYAATNSYQGLDFMSDAHLVRFGLNWRFR